MGSTMRTVARKATMPSAVGLDVSRAAIIAAQLVARKTTPLIIVSTTQFVRTRLRKRLRCNSLSKEIKA